MLTLVLGKARSHRMPNMGCWGAESPGDLMFHQNTLHEMWCMSGQTLLWWSCQSPVAHSCSLLSHLNSCCRGMFKLNSKLDADLLLYWLSHFECNSHTVQMLTQQCLLPALTTTVKSSLFMHVHSSPLSLAARLHRCPMNHSHYVNNVWTFPGQTWYHIHEMKNLTLWRY